MFELEGLTQKDLNVFTNNAHLIAQLAAFVTNDLAHAVSLSPPKRAFGGFTYTIPYQVVKWWTKYMLRSAKWRATYC
jgi:hypothetical protein